MARKLTSPMFYLSKYVISDGFPWVIKIFRQAKICSLIIRHLAKDFILAKAGHQLSKYLCVKTMKRQSKLVGSKDVTKKFIVLQRISTVNQVESQYSPDMNS